MSRLNESFHSLLTSSVIEKLFEKSIFTCLSFIRANPEYLARITGLHYNQILQITSSILVKFSSTLKYGYKYYQEVVDYCAIVPSGIENLDKLLDGGFMTGNIYELCGFSGCGKTQVCMTISANICSSCEHQVLFIDTKNDISAQRVFQMLEQRKMESVGEIMSRIQLLHVREAHGLLSALHDLERRLRNSKEKCLGFRIIIVDSLSSLFQRFVNQIYEGLPVLNSIANVFKFLAVEYHLVILLTNFVSTWIGDLGTNEENVEKVDAANIQQAELPALGKYWAHVPNVRVMIKKLEGSDERFLIILKSLNQPVGKATKVKISVSGVF